MAEPIEAEYQRCKSAIGDDDPYKTPNKLGIHDILHAHFLIADFFYNEGKGLGGIGPKNIDLLHSAVYRQHISYDGISKWSDFFEIAATLFYGLIKDHPFHDANKRTALLTLLFHLSENGYVPTVSGKIFEDFAVEIAENKYVTRRRFKALSKKGEDAEIKFIAMWLKKNTRKQFKKEYFITYRELDRILQNHGYELGTASGNFIDVNRVWKKKRLFSKTLIETRVRVGRIGFPSMTRQVPKGEVRKVRKMTELTVERGFDSEVFYKGQDPLGSLIAGYQDALRSLADR